MTVIKIQELTFGFDNQGVLLFDHSNLIMDSSWKLGLIGRNGRGKTTLLNLLQNKFPYEGKITHQLTFTYFPQKLQDKAQLTFYALNEVVNFEQWQLERELNLLGVDPEILWRPFTSLSGGEQTKVLLALLFVDELNFPLIDEPTNHLDVTGRKQVAKYLKQKKQGFIVVSHDRSFVDEVVDHILSIEKSQLVLYQGNFSVYEEQKRLRDKYELEQNSKLKKEIGRLQQTAAEKAEWARSREGDKTKKSKGFIDTEKRRVNKGAVGADAARTMKRSKAIINRLEDNASKKAELLKDIETVETLKMNFVPTHHKLLLQAENLTLHYQKSLSLFAAVSFELRQGERLAIKGANGVGKSSLIHYLMDHFNGGSQGILERPKKLTISYLRQNYEDNTGTLTEFAESHHLNYEDLLNNLRKLGVEREVFYNKIEDMSMGQRKRVELAKSLATPAELFIWDEPLNYLDVFNQEQLEAVIQSVQPTMVIVEHDETFLKHVATKFLELKK
ncbi:Lsa family ABC-F type ribosomal protection protein [Enterococcus saigonensis]|uniref:Lsa family ABC-F type ribosomal protection protein n=1 Tax=Enterococcus saigonensis TaxID=1805431 RepID=A0A679IJV7_9ENTE|nr:ABC-F type ribosomal protection protein [Enterococcus saigonensis]BCA84881.1 Lsa family ABC-F type ribosomal protection protein [Enterococcus saigonensis]